MKQVDERVIEYLTEREIIINEKHKSTWLEQEMDLFYSVTSCGVLIFDNRKGHGILYTAKTTEAVILLDMGFPIVKVMEFENRLAKLKGRD